MKKTALFAFSLLLICFSISCKKKNKDDCPLCPKIDALSPSSGKKGDTILITGSNFSNYLTNNIVKFNGVVVPASDMISGGNSELRVRVPAKCGTGPVTVTLDDELYSDGGPTFTYNTSALISVFAGSSGTSGNSNGSVTFKNLLMKKPSHVVVDASNNVYVIDNGNQKVRKLDVGTGVAEQLTDSTELENPCAIAVDENLIVYLSSFNYSNNKSTVYRLTPGSSFPEFYFSDPTVGKKHVCLSRVGTEEFYFSRINSNYAVIIPQILHYTAAKGVEAFADSSGNVIAYKNGTVFQIRTIPVGANAGTTLTKFNVNDKKETELLKKTVGLNQCKGLAVDDNGTIYISDSNNNRILKYSASGVLTTIVSSGLKFPQGIALDKQGNLYVADTENHCIKKITFE